MQRRSGWYISTLSHELPGGGQEGLTLHVDPTLPRCTEQARRLGEDPVGSAPHWSRCLVFELPAPWEARVELSRAFPDEPRQILRRLEARGERVRLQCVLPDRQYSSPGRTRLIAFSRPADALAGCDRTEYLVPSESAGEVARALLEVGAPRSGSIDGGNLRDPPATYSYARTATGMRAADHTEYRSTNRCAKWPAEITPATAPGLGFGAPATREATGSRLHSSTCRMDATGRLSTTNWPPTSYAAAVTRVLWLTATGAGPPWPRPPSRVQRGPHSPGSAGTGSPPGSESRS